MEYLKLSKEELVELLAHHTETFTRLLHEGASGIEYEESKRIVNDLVKAIREKSAATEMPESPKKEDPGGIKVDKSRKLSK